MAKLYLFRNVKSTYFAMLKVLWQRKERFERKENIIII